MDFTLSEEQALLGRSVDQFVAREMARPGGDVWPAFAELGWLRIGLPEEADGIGGGVETMLVCGGLGRALVTAPFVPAVVLGAGLLARLGRVELASGVAAGRLKVAVALSEPPDGFAPSRPAASAARRGAGFVLHGRKSTVLGAPEADLLLVPAMLDGRVAVFLLRPAAPGLTMLPARLADGRGVADLVLDGAEAELLAADAADALDHIADLAVAATCADAVGAMGAAVRITVEYLKTRRQFGAPLASLQVLQHRVVDMRMELEHAASLTEAAAMACDGDPAQRTRLVSAAKARVAKAARFVGEQAVQLHGGMGMTAEHVIGRYYKRLLGDEMLFGDRFFHLDRLAAA